MPKVAGQASPSTPNPTPTKGNGVSGLAQSQTTNGFETFPVSKWPGIKGAYHAYKRQYPLKRSNHGEEWYQCNRKCFSRKPQESPRSSSDGSKQPGFPLQHIERNPNLFPYFIQIESKTLAVICDCGIKIFGSISVLNPKPHVGKRRQKAEFSLLWEHLTCF